MPAVGALHDIENAELRPGFEHTRGLGIEALAVGNVHGDMEGDGGVEGFGGERHGKNRADVELALLREARARGEVACDIDEIWRKVDDRPPIR